MKTIWDNLTDFEWACEELGRAYAKGDQQGIGPLRNQVDRLSKLIDDEVLRLEAIEVAQARRTSMPSSGGLAKLPVMLMCCVALAFVAWAVYDRFGGQLGPILTGINPGQVLAAVTGLLVLLVCRLLWSGSHAH